MAEMLLTIQHGDKLFSPPVEDGVQIEWERTGSPGKLTFTTVGVNSGLFTEGDAVCFYYNNAPIFMGYVFTKKHDKENKIEVTCYDQLRYLKNKFTYVFEKKTATQIIQALCKDFNLHTGTMDNTSYVIPAIAEENKSAFDIILDVLEETLLNTGNMFVLYDDFGKLTVKNAANMKSLTLIYEDTAENFDYSSSIDSETYNQIILYYKQNGKATQMYYASSPTTIKQWGTLRYFEEVNKPTIGQNKADTLLKLYNRKTRELKITGAFGDVSVRGGTLIPVKLSLGDQDINNFMLVEKVKHSFVNGHHSMDLTLSGAWSDKVWNDPKYETESKTIGEVEPDQPSEQTSSGGSSGGWIVPCKYSRVTSPFGWRTHPIYGTRKYHNGVDLGASKGTPIYATRSGTVSTASYQAGGAGYYVSINHGGGYSSIYMHMTHYVVRSGQYVSAGQLIGYVGSTGASTGPHLHFGISYNGSYVNPTNYVKL